MNSALGVGGVVLTLLAVVLAILWIAMPFAIFGTKPLLKKLLEEQEITNELLRQNRPPQLSTTAIDMFEARALRQEPPAS
jgi:ABC-type sulfate transport system permease component